MTPRKLPRVSVTVGSRRSVTPEWIVEPRGYALGDAPAVDMRSSNVAVANVSSAVIHPGESFFIEGVSAGQALLTGYLPDGSHYFKFRVIVREAEV